MERSSELLLNPGGVVLSRRQLLQTRRGLTDIGCRLSSRARHRGWKRLHVGADPITQRQRLDQ